MLMTNAERQEFLNNMWTDDIPDADGEYLVTFLANWTSWTGEAKQFRGIDIIECGVDEDEVTWYTQDIEKRFPNGTVTIVAWMELPEACE